MDTRGACPSPSVLEYTPLSPTEGLLDLADFSMGGMLRAGLALRQAVRGASTLEAAAGAIVRYLYEYCGTGGASPNRACALVRFYKTHPFALLEPALQRFASAQMSGGTPAPSLRCLTLMATAGDQPAWNSRHLSVAHRAMPLLSADRMRSAPMILRLIEDLGIEVDSLLTSAQAPPRGRTSRVYDVFHVEHAAGSPFIPAQHEFVVPHGIASVVGFGGLLRTGELFAVVLFSRTHIPPESAARFRAIALDVRSALFGFDDASTWSA